MLLINSFVTAGSTAAGAIIAYSNDGSLSPRTNASGVLNRTNLMGFGSASGNVTVEKEDLNGESVLKFTIDATADFYSFPMPYDGKITAVAGRYSTITAWTSLTADISLYVAVAIAPVDSNTYTIIPESKALAPKYERGVPNLSRAVRTGLAEDLSIPVSKGQNVALIVGFDTANGTLNQDWPFNFTGSITIEKS